MSEVVIAAIGRTPIGRAVKGSLIEQRPDDLGAYVVDEVPRTSVGKHDKKLLRERYSEGSLNVVVSDEPPKAHPAT